MLAKKADVDRTYLPYQEGRRSLMNLDKEYTATMIGLQTYMMTRMMSRYKLSSDTKTPRLLTLYPRKLRNAFIRLEQQMT